jgi:hypothetical protein
MAKAEENFYVTLPSNSSMEEFPDNSLTNYTSRLAFPLQLSNDNWEVGLWELLHPNSWKNDGDVLDLNMADDLNNFALTLTIWKTIPTDFDAVTRDYSLMPHPEHKVYIVYGTYLLAYRLDYISLVHEEESRTNWVGQVYALNIPKIHPTDREPATLEKILLYLQRLFDRIQLEVFGSLEEGKKVLTIGQDKTSKERDRVTVRRMKKRDQFKVGTSEGNTYLDLHIEGESRLARLLGFSDKKGLKTYHGTEVAANLPSRDELAHLVVKRKIYSLYIYSDAIQAQLIGDTHAKILRVVPVHSDRAQDVTIAQRFNNIQYCKTSKTRFDTIEIDIRDDTGRPVPFVDGRVTAILHFRKAAY